MKDWNNLDKHLNSLSKQEETNPPSFVWDDIGHHLDTKNERKRRRFLFLILSLILLSFIIGLALNQNPIIGNNKLAKNHNSQIIKNRDLPTESENTYDIKENIEIFSDENEVKEISLTSKKNAQEKTAYHENISKTASSNNQTRINNKPSSQRIHSYSSSNSTSETMKPTPSSNSTLLSKPINTSNSTTNTISSFIGNQRPMMAGILSLKLNSNFLKLIPSKIEKLTLELSPTNEIGKPVAVSSSKYFIQLSTLIGRHNTHLNKNSANQNHYRFNTESNWYSWGAKINGAFCLNQYLYISTGLSFIESRDKFEYRAELVQLDETMNSVASTEFRTVKANYYNLGDISYRQLNIPLSLGIQTEKGIVTIGMESGVIFNAQFKTEGKVQTANMEFSRLENESIYKSNIGFGMSNSGFVGLKMNENNSLIMKGSYLQYFSNTTLPQELEQSKLSLFVLELGYRFSF